MAEISDISASTRPNIIITPPPRRSENNNTVDSSNSSEGTLTFKDALDVVNPLHQIPVVSTIYEKTTGDVPNPAARILGGFLFGGIFGMVAGIASAIVEQVSGKSIADNIISAFAGDKSADGETLIGDAGNDTLSYSPGVDMRGNTINPYLVASNFSSGTYAPAGSVIDSKV